MLLLNDEKIEELNIKNYKIIQSNNLYRFTSDAVLLSRFAKVKKGDKIADICSGSGIVGLHLFALNDDKISKVDLYEIQTPLAEMSEKSIELNGLNNIFTVHNTAIQNINKSDYGKFDRVLCNPPYKKKSSGENSKYEHLAICKTEILVTLNEIVITAKKLLKSGGRFYICHKVERISELLCTLENNNLYPTTIQIVASKNIPYLVLVEAALNVRPQLKVLSQIENNSTNFSGE